MGSAPTVRWVFSSPVPVLEVLVLGWADPPQAAVAHNVANPAAMMQAVLRRGNIMTLLAGRNSQRGVNHTCVVPGAARMSATVWRNTNTSGNRCGRLRQVIYPSQTRRIRQRVQLSRHFTQAG